MTAMVNLAGNCILAHFRARFDDAAVVFRVLLDNVPMKGHDPGGQQVLAKPFSGSPESDKPHFFFECGLASGAHEIRVQWRGKDDAGGVFALIRSLVVLGE